MEQKPRGYAPQPIEFGKITLPEAKKILPEFKALGLSSKELLFTAYYVSNGHNATQAYISANGCKKMSYNVAGNRASETIKNPRIQKALLHWFARWMNERKTALEKEIIEVYYRRAFYPTDVFFENDREPRPLKEIPKEWHVCIDGIEAKYYGKDADTKVLVYRLANREKALDQLAKYMGMFAENVVMNVNLSEGASKRMAEIFDFPSKAAQ